MMNVSYTLYKWLSLKWLTNSRYRARWFRSESIWNFEEYWHMKWLSAQYFTRAFVNEKILREVGATFVHNGWKVQAYELLLSKFAVLKMYTGVFCYNWILAFIIALLKWKNDQKNRTQTAKKCERKLKSFHQLGSL